MKRSIISMLVVVVSVVGARGVSWHTRVAEAADPLRPKAVRQEARAAGLDALHTVEIPEPSNLSEFLQPGEVPRTAAVRLGKALFWDMQVGSDGQACASCHFHAFADNRTKNQLSPGLKNLDPLMRGIFNPTAAGGGGPNYELMEDDFPFHQLADPENRHSEVLFDTDDVTSSQGVSGATFAGIVPGEAGDAGDLFADPVFNVTGMNVRRVEPRNTPTVINSVFNFANFWDGRAHNVFNGATVLGPLDDQARVLVVRGGALVQERVRIPNASLASQAVGPPLSDLEMSFFERPFPAVGRKLLALRPLGLQLVHPQDGALGSLSRARLENGALVGAAGLNTTYAALIRAAFRPEYWNSAQLTNGYTHMEANFSLFFGLAVQMYESTLIADGTPFDEFMEGDDEALEEEQLAGLRIFIGRGNCVNCHGGPELTDAAFTNLAGEGDGDLELIEVEESPKLVARRLVIGAETLFLDNGFSNIGVRPSAEDPGRGGVEGGHPLSFIRQALAGLSFGPEVPACGAETDGAEDNESDEEGDAGDDEETLPCPEGGRVAVDGAFKVPGLRNVELTGPFFHNGGAATLTQVVEFYDRQGDFSDQNIANLDRQMARIALVEGDEEPLVEFLLGLTDDRVRNEQRPFDHPQIFVPNGHAGTHLLMSCAVGNRACDDLTEVPAVGAGGRAALGLEPLKPFLGLAQVDPEDAGGDGEEGEDEDDEERCGGTDEACRVTLGSSGATFDELQDAIDAARNGTTITVRGTCEGPIRIVKRRDLTITGVAPAEGACPAEEPESEGLTSTVEGGEDQVIRVDRSANIVIRHLNIVGGEGSGVALKDASEVTVHCNCVAGNEATGLDVDRGKRHEITENLVIGNDNDGIHLERTQRSELTGNTVEENGDDGIELERGSDRNLIAANDVAGNGEDGVDLDDSDDNEVSANEVAGNGTEPSTDTGIELQGSDDNAVDANQIAGNADDRRDEVRCDRASDDNRGSNVTSRCD